MKDLKFIVGISLAALLFIVVMPTLEFNLNLVYLFFIAGNALVVFLVFQILKKGPASKKTFDEGNWYEDEVKS